MLFRSDTSTWLVTLETPDSPQQVHQYYKDNVKAPYTTSYDASQAGSEACAFATPDQKNTLTLSASADAGKTTILLSVTRAK